MIPTHSQSELADISSLRYRINPEVTDGKIRFCEAELNTIPEVIELILKNRKEIEIILDGDRRYTESLHRRIFEVLERHNMFWTLDHSPADHILILETKSMSSEEYQKVIAKLWEIEHEEQKVVLNVSKVSNNKIQITLFPNLEITNEAREEITNLALQILKPESESAPETKAEKPELSDEVITQIVKRMTPSLERILRHYDIPPEDREDILQNTFYELIKKWQRINSPDAYLIGTIRKKCIVYWRKKRGRVEEGVDAQILALLSEPQSPSQTKVADKAAVRRAWSKLNDREREVLKLRFWLGYGPGETAEKMGYQPSSIRKITNRALAALAKVLIEMGFFSSEHLETSLGKGSLTKEIKEALSAALT